MQRLFKSTGTLLHGLFAALAAVAVLAFVLAALAVPQAIQFLAVVASLVLAALATFFSMLFVDLVNED